MNVRRLFKALPSGARFSSATPYDANFRVGYAKYVNGVPSKTMRPLASDIERKWTYWSSNTAVDLLDMAVVFSEPNETYVVTRNGKPTRLVKGTGWVTPGLERVTQIIADGPSTVGTVARGVRAKDGQADVYVVVHFEHKDTNTSVFFNDGEGAERALALKVQAVVAEHFADLPTAASAEQLTVVRDAVQKALTAMATSAGVEINDVDVRLSAPVAEKLADKLVSVEPVPIAPTETYQADRNPWDREVPPSFFTSFRYGNNRGVQTPASASIEWVLPSPPEPHHFGLMTPKMTVSPEYVLDRKKD